MSDFEVGTQLRIKVEITDPNNSDAAIDPTTLVLAFKDPSGNVTTHTYGVDAEVIKSSTGVYYEDVTIDEAGRWSFKWTATGSAVGAKEDGFQVKETITA